MFGLWAGAFLIHFWWIFGLFALAVIGLALVDALSNQGYPTRSSRDIRERTRYGDTGDAR